MHRKLTEEEFKGLNLHVSLNLQNNPQLRLGQCWFNELHCCYPGLSEEIRGTKYDPYNSNKNLEAFYYYIKGDTFY